MKCSFRKVFVAGILFIILVLVSAISSAAVFDDFEYEIIDGEVHITLYKGNAEILEIPSEIEGLPVTSFSMGTFKEVINQDHVQEIILPISVRTLGDHALYQCNPISVIGLEHIECLEYCAITGAGSYMQDISLPSLKKIGSSSFSGKHISIPDNLVIEDPNSLHVSQGITLLESGSTPLLYSDQYGLYTYDRKKLIMIYRDSIKGHFVVPEGTEIIGEQALGYTDFEEITLPQSLKLIEENNFVASLCQNQRIYVYSGTYSETAMKELSKKWDHFKVYCLDQPDVKTYDDMIVDIVAEVIKPGMSEYQKAYALNQWVVDHVEYDYTYKKINWTDALLYGEGICNAYATLYGRLLTAAGLENGYSGNEEHIFNAVKISGKWTYIDTTWNDDPQRDFCFFGFNNEFRRKAYGDLSGSENFPAATARYHAYYVNGLYNDIIDEWYERVQQLINQTQVTTELELKIDYPVLDAYYVSIYYGFELAALLDEYEWSYPNAIKRVSFAYDETIIDNCIFSKIRVLLTTKKETLDSDYSYIIKDNMVSITGYNGTETNLIIPESIDEIKVGYIEEYAFSSNQKISSVIFPAGMKEIGSDAFSDCLNLITVKFSGPVDRIAKKAFYGCRALTEIGELSNVQSEIDRNAFEFCSSLTAVSLKAKYIGGGSFGNCHNLANIDLQDGIEIIDSCAFYPDPLLSEISFPSSLKQLGEDVFSFDLLSKVTIYECSADAIKKLKDSGFDNILNIKPHELVKKDVIEPTCTETGIESHWECALCGQKYSDSTATSVPVIIDSKGHSLTYHAAIAASCVETGMEMYWECTTCEKLYVDEFATNEISEPVVYPALGHSFCTFDKVEPTCTEDGHDLYWECIICGGRFCDINADKEYVITDDYIAKGHNLIEHNKIAVACTEDRSGRYWECSKCGKFFSDEKATSEILSPVLIVADGHYLAEHVMAEPTCSENGIETYWECLACGKLFSDENAGEEIEKPVTIAALGHAMIYHTAIDATCTETGMKTYWECTTCGKFFVDENATTEILSSVVIAAKGHNLAKFDRVEPTCTEDGHELYWECSTCGKKYCVEDAATEYVMADYFVAKGHNLIEHATIAASCIEAGIGKYWECTKCGKFFSDEKAASEISSPVLIVADGHNLAKHARVEPTCSENGIEAYWECLACGEIFLDEKATMEIERPITIAALGHVVNYHAAIDASCTETGTEMYWECVACGKLFSDLNAGEEIERPITIAAIGHTLTKHPTINASCTEPGTETYCECITCGKLFEDENAYMEILTPVIINAKGHNLIGRDRTEPTCTEDGIEAYWECSACGKLYSDETAIILIEEPIKIIALSHDWNAPEYEWAEDNSFVIASRVCLIDESHKETEKVSIEISIVSPTKFQEGSASYISDEFDAPCFNAQIKNEIIPALNDMTVLYLPAKIQKIGDEAFEGSDCQAVIVPASCTSIGSKAFRNNVNLKYVKVPNKTKIAPDAFEGCKNVIIDRSEE